jgi:PHP-associated
MPASGSTPARANGRGAGWYRGDCHLHSVYSDGELTPDRLAADARATGLDFVATTEHNSAEAHGVWERLGSADLLVLLGEEVTTKAGHWLALGIGPGQVIDWDYRVGDQLVGRCLEQVHASGGLAVAAHPHAPYPSGTFMYPYQGFDVVEVWNGLWASDRPWNADNEAALAEWGRALAEEMHAGRWRPAMGNSDTHLPGQIGVPHTVVFADDLSSEAVLAGIRAGRSWIAGSAAVELTLTAVAAGHEAGIGEHLTTRGEPVVVRAQLRGVPSATVSFHTDRGRVHAATLPASGAGTAEWQTASADSVFVRIEVRHPEGHMAALSNPIVLS